MNECLLGTDNCTQICVNSVGGFICQCFNGFTLDTDKINCRSWYIYFHANIYIHFYNSSRRLYFINCFEIFVMTCLINKIILFLLNFYVNSSFVLITFIKYIHYINKHHVQISMNAVLQTCVIPCTVFALIYLL